MLHQPVLQPDRHAGQPLLADVHVRHPGPQRGLPGLLRDGVPVGCALVVRLQVMGQLEADVAQRALVPRDRLVDLHVDVEVAAHAEHLGADVTLEGLPVLVRAQVLAQVAHALGLEAADVALDATRAVAELVLFAPVVEEDGAGLEGLVAEVAVEEAGEALQVVLRLDVGVEDGLKERKKEENFEASLRCVIDVTTGCHCLISFFFFSFEIDL